MQSSIDEGRFSIFLRILIPEISDAIVLIVIERIDSSLRNVSRVLI
jgi:hypothetical protein